MVKRSFTPKVSIIIPVYNGSNYLREAIDSALSQTYKNIEVIVVNDGSTDETDKICKSYGSKIRYFKKENGGVSTALNKGIEEMKGEYFSWLSHDDIYYPNKVEVQIKILSKIPNNDDVILYSDFEIIDQYGNSMVEVHNDHQMLEEKPEYALMRVCLNGITLLVPKEAFEKCGLFDPLLKCTQDYTKWKEMMNEFRFIHSSKILTKTRIHDKQGTKTNPKCEEEGNNLWISMMQSLSRKDKIRLEGTEYAFYKKMAEFLESSTSYKVATGYALNQMKSSPIFDKVIYHTKQYGFKATCKKVIEKILKKG